VENGSCTDHFHAINKEMASRISMATLGKSKALQLQALLSTVYRPFMALRPQKAVEDP
jgi:hypothetical protein